MKLRKGVSPAGGVIVALVVIALVGGGAYAYLHSARSTNPSSPTSAGLQAYLVYADGTKVPLSSVQLSTVTIGGGGSAVQFQPYNGVSYSGDTITGGSCSGSVSFKNTGTVSITAQPMSSSIPSSYTSGGALATTIPASVSLSTFDTQPSGTYTLTATYTSSCMVTFTNGGPDSGVSFAASSSPSKSVTYTVSGGVVSGVTATVG